MALDGFVISNLTKELNDKLANGRISKIHQPEKNELMISINNNRNTYKLFMSANPSLPLLSLTNTNKQNPKIPPAFCMLLRKHINNARIISVIQEDLERIIRIKIEHFDELGDLSFKFLIIELMGRHSNIIFCNEEDMIIDSIKRVSHAVSSIREVLPGRQYFQPGQLEKISPFLLDYDVFCEGVLNKPLALFKAIYTSVTGFSPLMANELCNLSSVDPNLPARELSTEEKQTLFDNLKNLISRVSNEDYEPNIIYKDDKVVEFSCFLLSIYENHEIKKYSSISEVLESYYGSSIKTNTIKQKSANLRKIVSNAIERTSKKLDLQIKQYKDTDKKEKFRIYGELINTYGYNIDPKKKKFTAINYYDGNEIEIPLDPNLSMVENAQKYFKKYNKLKRTFEALTLQIRDSKNELKHLDSIQTYLEIADSESDLAEIKEELMDFGYVKRRSQANKNKRKNKNSKSKPYHYISSDGFHMYVGKNNYQNDELTFKFASNDDWWFHAKGIAGSHVIVKSARKKLTKTTQDEAARLAAYYSKGRDSGKVEIDYTQKRHLNKPKGAKPGFVTYQTYNSVVASTNIKDINTK